MATQHIAPRKNVDPDRSNDRGPGEAKEKSLDDCEAILPPNDDSRKGVAMTLKRVFRSPIEVMLRNGIVEGALHHGVCILDSSVFNERCVIRSEAGRHSVECDQTDFEEWGASDDVDSSSVWSMHADVALASYRIDFVIGCDHVILAIECDGHQWHDRTKQQAAYDRSRDRELLALGIPTLRFTGSEIHHCLERCVEHVFLVGKKFVDIVELAPMDAWRSGYDTGMRRAMEPSQSSWTAAKPRGEA